MKTYKIFCIFIVILSGCKNPAETAENAEKHDDDHEIAISLSEFKKSHMKLGQLSKQQFNQGVNVNGKIDVPPQNKAQVSTFMGGYVRKTPLLTGDKVKKGQLLVTLENTAYIELQQEYAQLAEQLQYLKSEYERQKTLFAEKISSKKNFLKAESTYKSTLAVINGLEKKLQMLGVNPMKVRNGYTTATINIYSPINGTISKVNVSNGKYVAPADVIMEIIDNQHIHLELTVYEKDILNINKGQKINFKIPEASDSTYKAKVYLVGNKIDETNRSVQVHGHLENEKEHFLIGMFTEAEIITRSETAEALPNEAFVEIDDKYYILILKEKNDSQYIFEQAEVEIEQKNKNYKSIKNPTQLNDKQILIKGAKILISPELESGHSH